MPGVEFFSVSPRIELAPFVEAIWGVRGSFRDASEAVLPNGAIELMINFGPVQRVVAHGERTLDDTYSSAWLAGIQDRRLVHLSEHGADHLSVRFRPGGAHAFFGLPMGEVANSVTDLELLIGAEATSLRDRLGAAATDLDRVRIIEAWLLDRRRVHSGFSTVQQALGLLGHPDRPASVTATCERLGLSNKHLIHEFRSMVGLPPKVIARILRFQRVVLACRDREAVDWLDLVHQHGFSDQSHLIREFRRLGSVTPTAFLDAPQDDWTSLSAF